MRRRNAPVRTAALLSALAIVAALAVGCSSGEAPPLRIGAVYPLDGSQGPGGVQEYRGARLAAEFVNDAGGVQGRRVQLHAINVPGADAATSAVSALHAEGYRLVIGSYGSTISVPAAEAAAGRGMLFWETGAIAEIDDDAAPAAASAEQASSVGDAGGMIGGDAASIPVAPASDLVFHVPPTGAVLGRAGIDFMIDQYAARLHRAPSGLRFAVANVDDVYGRSVARGALDALRARGLRVVGTFPYDEHTASMAALARRIAAARPDILFVSAYVKDGVGMRRQLVRAHVPLVAAIGSSSSYCMPAFGAALGRDAVGLFASDKPDAESIDPAGLRPDARELLERASTAYRKRYGAPMSSPALAGFSAAWALFHDVMPAASSLTPEGVASAARAVDVPRGGLPNGSGLRFAPAGSSDAGSNLLASSVIWEWVGVDHRAVVWPPEFATQPPEWIPISS
jgi:branched-chain amino acid transport system substrate-binding protein